MNETQTQVTKPTIILASNEIEAIQLCPRLHYFGKILRIEPLVKSEKMEKGVLFHKALEYYYRNKKDSGKLTIEDISELTRNHATTLELGIEDINEVITSFKGYTSYYTHEDWTIDDVEAEFLVPIYEDDDIIIMLEGVMDLLITVSRTGMKAVVDHKYSGKNFEPPSRQIQSKTYCLASNRRDFYLNQIGNQKSYSLDKRLQRYYFNYSEDQLEEYRLNIIEATQDILRNWERVNNKSFIPGRETACMKYNYKCTFWNICESTRDHWEYIINRDFRKKKDNKLLLSKG